LSQKHLPEYDSTQALLVYENPVSYLIRALKFNAHYPCARLLGMLMAEKLSASSDKPEQIIPVPLHPQRYHQRGFNQAIEIARPIAGILNIPLNLTCCSRTLNTPPQARLSANERKKNLKNAFSVVKAPPAEHIAILDDVVTTGSTVDELAKALRKAGIKRIDVWACARA
jgi:ComF family protein